MEEGVLLPAALPEPLSQRVCRSLCLRVADDDLLVPGRSDLEFPRSQVGRMA